MAGPGGGGGEPGGGVGAGGGGEAGGGVEVDRGGGASNCDIPGISDISRFMRDGMLLLAPEDDADAVGGDALPIRPIVLGVGVGIGVANVVVCELTAARCPPSEGVEGSCSVGADGLVLSAPDSSRDGNGGVGMTEV